MSDGSLVPPPQGRPAPAVALRVVVQFTAQDLLDAQRLALRPSRRLRPFVTVGLPIGVAGLAFMTYEWISGGPLIKHDSSIGLFLPVCAALFVGWLLFMRSFARKTFAQDKAYRAPVTFEIDEDGVRATSEFGASTRPWAHFRRWKVDRRVLLLYPADAVMQVVPLRAFVDPGERAHLMALVQRHLGSEGSEN